MIWGGTRKRMCSYCMGFWGVELFIDVASVRDVRQVVNVTSYA